MAHIGTTDYGTQVKSIGFYDPAESGVVNKRNVNVQERGIYAGGYITQVSGNTCSLSPLVCIIGDANYQLRIATTNAITVTPDSTKTTVILRWEYHGAQVSDYMDVIPVAPGDVGPYDLVVAVGTFVGANLSSIENYGNAVNPRTEARVPELMLKVEETKSATGPHVIPAPSMYVRVRAGRVNYGSVNRVFPNTKSPLFAAAVTNPRIDVLYIDTDGALKVFTGVEAGSPVAPLYQNKAVLAEVTISVAMTQITQAVIKDVRSFTSPSADASSTFPSMTGNAYKYLRVKLDETGLEFKYPTYAP